MYNRKLIMPIKEIIMLRVAMSCENEMGREELLVTRIRQLRRQLEYLDQLNKGRLNRMHQLQIRKIEEGAWMIMYDNTLDNQHN